MSNSNFYIKCSLGEEKSGKTYTTEHGSTLSSSFLMFLYKKIKE